jgi:hypothetical protein
MSWKKITLWSLLALIGLFFLLLLIVIAPSVWRHFITYPALDAELAALEKERHETPKVTSLNLYRGILHAHCYWSHDSRGKLEEFIPAAKKAGIDFIFFTDHPHADLDSFPRAYYGRYKGILIEPGSEKKGILAWPLDSMVIDWRIDHNQLYKQIISQGGLVFYAHTEESHDWDNPDFQGMEIYNIHTDSKDENMISHVPNMTINGASYRRWAYWEVFDEQTEILSRWDTLNQRRRIVGITAADAHDNQNFRARYLDDGRVEWSGVNTSVIDTTEAGLLEWILLSEPDTAGWAFKWQMDSYYASFMQCTNYLFADTLSSRSIAGHLRSGHLFTAFHSLADAQGFIYYSRNKNGDLSGIMGDSVQTALVQSLNAVSPLPGQFRLVRNGKLIDTVTDAYEYHYEKLIFPGVYRVEVRLFIDSAWQPWIYTNPIYIYE